MLGQRTQLTLQVQPPLAPTQPSSFSAQAQADLRAEVSKPAILHQTKGPSSQIVAHG